MPPAVLELSRNAKFSQLKLEFYCCDDTELLDDMDGAARNMQQFVESIYNAPFRTFTVMEVHVDCEQLLEETFLEQRYTDEGCSDQDTMRLLQFILRVYTDCDKWFNPWFGFKEERMKQIGLRKLDIEFKCAFGFHFQYGRSDEHLRGGDESIQNKVRQRLLRARAFGAQAIWKSLSSSFTLDAKAKEWKDRDASCETSIVPEDCAYIVRLSKHQ